MLTELSPDQVHTQASRLIYCPCPFSRADVHPATAVETFQKNANWSSRAALKSLKVKSGDKTLGTMKLLTALHSDREFQNRDTYIFVHGRGGGLGSVIDLANHVYKLGANVALFNYVGEQANAGYLTQESAVASMQAALLHLEKVIGLSPERIKIVAASMGADTAAVALGKLCQADPNRKYAELNFVAPPILDEMVQTFLTFDKAMIELNQRLQGGFLKALKLENSLSWLKEIRARKVNVHHGRLDQEIPYRMGEKWFQALNAAQNIDVLTMKEYPDCGHHQPQYRIFGLLSPLERKALATA